MRQRLLFTVLGERLVSRLFTAFSFHMTRLCHHFLKYFLPNTVACSVPATAVQAAQSAIKSGCIVWFSFWERGINR